MAYILNIYQKALPLIRQDFTCIMAIRVYKTNNLSQILIKQICDFMTLQICMFGFSIKTIYAVILFSNEILIFRIKLSYLSICPYNYEC